MPALKPLDRFSKKIGTVDYVEDPYLTSKFWGQSVQMGRVCTCVKLSPAGVYFSPFLGFMRLATGRPVGPIITAPWWHSRPFYSFVNKKISPIFHPKMVTLKSYNFGIVEDTYNLFAPNRGFSGSANLMVSFKPTPDQPFLPW